MQSFGGAEVTYTVMGWASGSVGCPLGDARSGTECCTVNRVWTAADVSLIEPLGPSTAQIISWTRRSYVAGSEQGRRWRRKSGTVDQLRRCADRSLCSR